ncbi:tRNA wybutosine-synthesizing protein 3 homolog [Ptychodera flava]|uniref:tRNA wybutosine-synthesizing protein 3 homolog n=1 Tax=Ptychodera flava TaxID=63121 RepID=UPI00396A0A1F
MAASMRFQRWKEASQSGADFSKKGSIDSYIVSLVGFINSQENYFTTSSCSGRVCVYSENNLSGLKKKGCTWLYTTHEYAESGNILDAIKNSEEDAVFKFEPFVLHVQCKTLEDARIMHQVSVESGFRNSGISLGKSGKIITAVRSTHGLEVPLTSHGIVLVSDQYVEYLVKLANEKLEENMRRIDRFFSNLKIHMDQAKGHVSSSKTKNSSLNCGSCGQPITSTHSKGQKPAKHTGHVNPSRTEKNKTEKTQCNGDSKNMESDEIEDIGSLFNT